MSELALGTAMFGTRPGARTNPEQARAVLDAYSDAGGNFIDTSDAYELGEAEAVLGDLLTDRREQFVLATKYTRMPHPGVNLTGNSRRTAIRSVEASLRRLKTDYLDVLWVHLPDGVTPIDEILATFDDLTRSGKILHGGLSNFPAWRVAAAAVKSPTLLGVQEPLNLLNRDLEREMLPAAEAFGLGVCTYYPLASGRLTGKYRQGEKGRFTDMNLPLEDAGQRKQVLDMLLEISQEADEEPGRVAMAWLRARADRATTAIVPIIGPRTPEQLQDYVNTLALDLEPEHYRRLDEASAPSIADNTSYAFGGEFDRFKPSAVPVI